MIGVELLNDSHPVVDVIVGDEVTKALKIDEHPVRAVVTRDVILALSSFHVVVYYVRQVHCHWKKEKKSVERIKSAVNQLLFHSVQNQLTFLPLAIVQELCESRGGRPVLSVLTSLLASVDVKLY